MSRKAKLLEALSRIPEENLAMLVSALNPEAVAQHATASATPATAATPATPRGREARPPVANLQIPDCDGNCGFECYDIIKLTKEGSGDAAVKWLAQHRCVYVKPCESHPDACDDFGRATSYTSKIEGGRLVHRCKVFDFIQEVHKHKDPVDETLALARDAPTPTRKKDNACRRSLKPLTPFRARFPDRTSRLILNILWNMATGQPTTTHSIRACSGLENISPATMCAIENLIGDACTFYVKEHPLDMTNCTEVQVDETYVGKRKYHRGKSARHQKMWFVTVTQAMVDDDGNRHSGDTRWTFVEHRTKPELTEIVRKHVSDPFTKVVTDAFAAYNGLQDLFNHKVVNHRVSFKNFEGDTTNMAESAHGTVKAAVKRLFTHYGRSVRAVEGRFNIAAMMHMKKAGQERFNALAECLREAAANPKKFHEFRAKRYSITEDDDNSDEDGVKEGEDSIEVELSDDDDDKSGGDDDKPAYLRKQESNRTVRRLPKCFAPRGLLARESVESLIPTDADCHYDVFCDLLAACTRYSVIHETKIGEVNPAIRNTFLLPFHSVTPTRKLRIGVILLRHIKGGWVYDEYFVTDSYGARTGSAEKLLVDKLRDKFGPPMTPHGRNVIRCGPQDVNTTELLKAFDSLHTPWTTKHMREVVAKYQKGDLVYDLTVFPNHPLRPATATADTAPAAPPAPAAPRAKKHRPEAAKQPSDSDSNSGSDSDASETNVLPTPRPAPPKSRNARKRASVSSQRVTTTVFDKTEPAAAVRNKAKR